MIDKLNEIVSGIKNYPLVFISGAYRSRDGHASIDNEEVKKNIEIAADLTKELWEYEIGVLCPHLGTNMKLSNCENHQLFLDTCLKMQMICDAIVMLPDWEESKGATREKEFAEKIGQPVYYANLKEMMLLRSVWFINCEERNFGYEAIREFGIRLNRECNSYPNQFMALRVIQAMSYFLHVNKNKDYSSRNILGTGMVGLTTRLWDKAARYMNLMGFDIDTGEYSGSKNPKNESIDDTLVDLANYAQIGLIYKSELWGK